MEKVLNDDEPRIAKEPIASDNPRVAPHLARQLASANKNVKVAPTSRWDKPVTWCLTKKDVDGAWTWGEKRQWTDDEWNDIIAPAFSEFRKLNWQQIDAQGSGSGHKMHHPHEVSDLADEAQGRWRHLNLQEYDVVFRFRLGGTRRVWGYIVQAHFHFVWWERYHKIYPVE